MKITKYFFPISLFALILLFGCSKDLKGSENLITSERSVPVFDGVILDGSFDLYITQDSIQKVSIITDNNMMDLIETNVVNGVLKIGVRSNESFNANRADVYVSCTALKNLTLNGSGKAESQNTITGEFLKIDLYGSGNAALKFEGKEIIVSHVGSGDMTVSGKTERARYTLEGSGSINASGLKTAKASANISGSGNISLASKNELEATINGSGDIICNSSPNVIKKITGSGKVVLQEEK